MGTEVTDVDVMIYVPSYTDGYDNDKGIYQPLFDDDDHRYSGLLEDE